jgi:lipopolysaccharide biosynthesis regulator YciM
MNPPEGIRTLTMARIYAQQEHYQKAIEIYRHLAAAHPERIDIRDELAAVEAEMASAAASENNLDRLLSEWVRLMVAYRRLHFLQEMKQKLLASREDQNERGHSF